MQSLLMYCFFCNATLFSLTYINPYQIAVNVNRTTNRPSTSVKKKRRTAFIPQKHFPGPREDESVRCALWRAALLRLPPCREFNTDKRQGWQVPLALVGAPLRAQAIIFRVLETILNSMLTLYFPRLSAAAVINTHLNSCRIKKKVTIYGQWPAPWY
jgi:hypothetical protein